MQTKIIVKEWGNSLGIIIPKEIIRQEHIKLKDEVIIDIKKKVGIMSLFGSLKFKKSSQEMKDEDKKAWGE